MAFKHTRAGPPPSAEPARLVIPVVHSQVSRLYAHTSHRVRASFHRQLFCNASSCWERTNKRTAWFHVFTCSIRFCCVYVCVYMCCCGNLRCKADRERKTTHVSMRWCLVPTVGREEESKKHYLGSKQQTKTFVSKPSSPLLHKKNKKRICFTKLITKETTHKLQKNKTRHDTTPPDTYNKTIGNKKSEPAVENRNEIVNENRSNILTR